jgi:hypothetical protein
MNRIKRAPIVTAWVFALVTATTALAQDDSKEPAVVNTATSVADAISDLAADDSQEFRLFESIDNAASPAARARNQARATRGSRAAASSSTPEFSLLGTTRIGDDHRVILRHKDGDTIVVKAGSNAATRITGHSDYTITEIESGRVSLNYPAGTPCVDSPDQGVKCTGKNNSAQLTLVKGAPLAPRRRQSAEPEVLQLEPTSGSIPPDVAPVNPFTALGAAADANAAAASSGGGNSGSARFNPRRISPEDVPPGMRVVSTPFGDRLVDQ